MLQDVNSDLLKDGNEYRIGPGGRYFIPIKVIKDGEIFGELSLVSNKPRAATIKCLTDCHFATLDKRTFEIIKKHFEKSINNKVEIIMNIPCFNRLTRVALSKF